MKAIVVGGSSGMGKAAAKHFVDLGGEVLICSRSEDKLNKAALFIGGPPGAVTTRCLDNTNEAAVKAFFESLPTNTYNALIVTALGRAVHGPFLSLDTSQAKELFEGKLWGPWYCAKYGAPVLTEGGGIVFVSGVLNRRPGANCSPLGAANGAVEALTRSLALELGPRLRVNCLSPGFVDTERFDHLAPDRRAAMLEATADSLPLKCVGEPAVIGEALYFLATNRSPPPAPLLLTDSSSAQRARGPTR
jgi:NAD(P)-dependent dehydrogenase (short-subunit alcohol dehydrogenase family)